jgi:hypothetical protein
VGSVLWTRDKIPAPDDLAVLLFFEGDDFRDCNAPETGRPVRGLHPFPANRVRSWFNLFSLSAGSHQSPISEISTLARSFLPWARENPIDGLLLLSWNPQNWSARASLRRSTCWPNGIQPKAREPPGGHGPERFRYNLIRIHRTLRAAPAAGVADRLWEVSDLVALWESEEQRGRERAAEMKRFLRLLALVGTAAYAMSFLLHVCFDPRQDIPGEVWAGLLFLFPGLIYP